MDRDQLFLSAANAAIKAGEEIMSVYDTNFSVSYKEDKSPVTVADKRAHAIISKELSKTSFPILSEEGDLTPYEERKKWKQFWMVDPLDGTKEFIHKTNDFAVNIALMENNIPTMGFIYIPVTRWMYFSDLAIGGFKYKCDENPIETRHALLTESISLPIRKNTAKPSITVSRSHLNLKTKQFITQLKKQNNLEAILRRGSAIKLCLVAEDSGIMFPRFSPTMEWDTAAGHAIINASGGEVIDWETKKPLRYNKKNLLNPSFIARTRD